MADYLIKDTTLEGIADAIREKRGTVGDILTEDFADEILQISVGGNADNFPLTYKDDYYVDHLTGEEVYESGDHCTDFVDISGYSKIIAYHTDDWQNKFYNVFYDENENYISYFTVNGYVDVTVPNNAKYVRLSTAKTSPCMVIGYN